MRLPVRPRWIVLAVLVVFVSVGCAILGFWQLDRLEERRSANTVIRSRLGAEPVPMQLLLDALQPQEGLEVDPADYEYTRVRTAGVLTDEGRVLVRSHVVDGQAGVHVVFPLDLGEGNGVLVNVGWFPIGVDPAPAAELYGPDGRIELLGFLRADQQRPALGRREPEGWLETVARIDVGRIQQQVGVELLPFWIQLIEPNDPGRLPVPLPAPELDERSHLSYAVQWFSFGLIALLGYVALMRKELKSVVPTRVEERRPRDRG
ncbi:MAG: SURF1 family protein [bacterium]|nr:SURF1 family protein [bacterium]